MMYYECVSADWLDSFLGTKVWDAEFCWHVGPPFFPKLHLLQTGSGSYSDTS